jgi:CheY-like chemotaxis protein
MQADRPSQPKGLHILLAEDNRINQTVATRMLEKMGHSLVVADNGMEALSLLATQPFDLVLMDIQMPEMDGLTATMRIRESEKSTQLHMPIIAMTAHAMKGDRERCIEAGWTDMSPSQSAARSWKKRLPALSTGAGCRACHKAENPR